MNNQTDASGASGSGDGQSTGGSSGSGTGSGDGSGEQSDVKEGEEIICTCKTKDGRPVPPEQCPTSAKAMPKKAAPAPSNLPAFA